MIELPDELASLARRQDQVLGVEQAVTHLSPKAIRHRLETGRWQRVHRSVIVTHSGPVGLAQRRWAAVLAAGPDAVLAGLSAAQAAGLTGFDRPLLLPAHRQARGILAGVVIHRTSVLQDHDVLDVTRPPRTRTARSMVDAAQWARSDAEARALVVAGFQQRLVRGDDVSSCPQTGRH